MYDYTALILVRTDLDPACSVRKLKGLAKHYGYSVGAIIRADTDPSDILVPTIRRVSAETVFVPTLAHIPNWKTDILPIADIVTFFPRETYSRIIPTAERLADWYLSNGLRRNRAETVDQTRP